MGKVVYINNAEAGGDPHLTGDAICSACNKEWTAVAPLGTKELECPDCKTLKGLFKHHLAPITPKVWACLCGTKLFYILSLSVQCCNCGQITKQGDIQ